MILTENNEARYKKVNTITVDIRREDRKDGTIILHSAISLDPYPFRLTERFKEWATHEPERIFIGRRNSSGHWETLSYAEAFTKVLHIAQSLLNRKISPLHPIAILSENSIEHALLALAALHVGIPYSSITPAYSLRSTDFNKLKYIIDLLDPRLIFVQDANKYERALHAVAKGIEVIAVSGVKAGSGEFSFGELLKTPTSSELEKAHQQIQPSTIAKILFTSGSTGQPKGVINTHENISTNWQQITQTFPFLKDPGLEFIDWLPWNHTFGGNHNFGLAIYNGGTLYLDDGNPTPEGIAATVANLKERHPTIYFNVPKGFEALIPFFRKDPLLKKHFFSNLKMIFYAGAGMPQHVWDDWEQFSEEAIGERILIGTGLGCTESSPSALFASEHGGFAGLLGVPVPGLELKLVRKGQKLEARYRGKNIFPGYWRQEELTADAFDDEGFYCTGDALKFVDERDANKGLVFDGRFAEDFKLSSGTWVRVGILRSQIIAAANGLIHDVVIAGHDRDFIAAIIFPGFDECKKLIGGDKALTHAESIQHGEVRKAMTRILTELAQQATGTSNLVRRAVLVDFDLSIDRGEITDKGTINQGMVIFNHQDLIGKLFEEGIGENIIEVRTDAAKEID